MSFEFSYYAEKLAEKYNNIYSYPDTNPTYVIKTSENILVKCEECLASKKIKLYYHLYKCRVPCPCFHNQKADIGMRKLSYYIEIFNKRYSPDKFDYSNNDFNGIYTDNDIIRMNCKRCGKSIVRTISYHRRAHPCDCKVRVRQERFAWKHHLDRFEKFSPNNFEYSLTENNPIISCHTLITVKCKGCKVIKEKRIIDHLRRPFCYKCTKTCPLQWNMRFQNILFRAHGDLYDYSRNDFSKISRTSEKIIIHCTICENTWSNSIMKHVEQGCPNCWDGFDMKNLDPRLLELN